MATLMQLVRLQDTITKTEKKLNSLYAKRSTLIDTLKLNRPVYGRDTKSETLLTIDGVPSRLWIYAGGDVRIEPLTFHS